MGSRLSAAIPPLILAAVAITQIAFARTANLTPWKGGGFGMFSTLDHSGYRGVDVVVEDDNRSERLEIPPSLETAAARAAAIPADWLLEDLAKGIADRERRHDRDVARVTLVVWRTTFDRATLQANAETIRTFLHTADEAPNGRRGE